MGLTLGVCESLIPSFNAKPLHLPIILNTPIWWYIVIDSGYLILGGGVILGGGSKESVGQRSRDHPLQVLPHKTTMGAPRYALSQPG